MGGHLLLLVDIDTDESEFARDGVCRGELLVDGRDDFAGRAPSRSEICDEVGVPVEEGTELQRGVDFDRHVVDVVVGSSAFAWSLEAGRRAFITLLRGEMSFDGVSGAWKL